jgi:hypothetical protein
MTSNVSPAAEDRRETARDRGTGEFGRQPHADAGIVNQIMTRRAEAGGLAAGTQMWVSPDVGKMQALTDRSVRRRLSHARLDRRFATILDTFKTDEWDEIGVTLDLGDGGAPLKVYFHREASVDVLDD